MNAAWVEFHSVFQAQKTTPKATASAEATTMSTVRQRLVASAVMRLVSLVREGSYTFYGATETTMSHGEGWQFIQLGRFIERAAGRHLHLPVRLQLLLRPGHAGDQVADVRLHGLGRRVFGTVGVEPVGDGAADGDGDEEEGDREEADAAGVAVGEAGE